MTISDTDDDEPIKKAALRRRYISDDQAPLLENPLRRMPGPILLQSDLDRGTNAEGLALLMTQCIDYLELTLAVKERITCAVSLAYQHNACAVGTTNTIVIPMGLFIHLRNLVTRLSHSSQIDKIFAAQVPNLIFKEAEKERRQAILELMSGPLMTESAKGNLYRILPYLLGFVTFHELGHLVNGHLRAGLMGASTMSEVEYARELDQSMTARTLEFDADAFALFHSYRFALVTHGLTLQSKEWIYIMVTIAAYIAIVSFDTKSYIQKGFSTHSPAPIRMSMLTNLMHHQHKFFREMDAEIPDASAGLIDQVIRGIENAISEIGGSELTPYDVGIWEEVAWFEYGAILTKWAQIRPALAAVKYGNHTLWDVARENAG